MCNRCNDDSNTARLALIVLEQLVAVIISRMLG